MNKKEEYHTVGKAPNQIGDSQKRVVLTMSVHDNGLFQKRVVFDCERT